MYNPPVEYFRQVLQSDGLLIEQHENYVKQSYRNRCHVLTAQGVVPLSIPVLKGNSKDKTVITEIEIDYSQKWYNVHWRTIQAAYGRAPYFEFYSDYIQQVYERQPKYLFELNVELLRLYLKLLRLNKPLNFTDSYQSEAPAKVLDLRNRIHPKIIPDNLHVNPYTQVFGKQFVPELSIIDLLFTQGPASLTYLT
ncbi:WbqC family protein [Pontibacter sp. BT310]|uniref:WbqC family protein n=1 Tax=Pontibacter populi TaxID=890055 RepID=A0ABS6X7T0_9BACT|nr:MULTISPECIES: WbqC family protein [Pontibacter]MBJ6116846.1 WbqC family protein [Pontibacter sp. BT310]MBR0569268.1 WbqC family protein [Microvirga sp. STS03]MBW3363699.1 WbqC family protein [Pontibacter populi]